MRSLPLLACLTLTSVAIAADPKPLAIGSPMPDFDLPGVDGKNHTQASFRDAKVLAIVFTCNHCPTANAYEARLAKFQAEYAPKGVALVAISPNDPLAVRPDELGYTDLDDSFESMKVRARDHNLSLSLPLRRRDPGRVAGLRRPGHAARLRLRRRAQTPLSGPVRRRRGQARQVARRHQRRRGGPRRQARAGRDHPRPRLLDQVGRQAPVRPPTGSPRPTPSPLPSRPSPTSTP